ncbi:MAG: dTDP-4-dehydrorhamnose 3,5-epimerase, partial [Patiriisocius sp.]
FEAKLRPSTVYMQIIDTALDSVKIIEPKVFGDDRGFFLESWNKQLFEEHGLPSHFVQDNHSRSSQGVLRGLHYQLKNPQGKLVRVTGGEVFDVAVDMRKSSTQFGKWMGVLLSESNKRQLWVPPGFAHGFYVLSESADFQYKCTDYYAPEHERSLMWNDETVGVKWPIIEGSEPLLAAKDTAGLPIDQCDTFA